MESTCSMCECVSLSIPLSEILIPTHVLLQLCRMLLASPVFQDSGKRLRPFHFVLHAPHQPSPCMNGATKEKDVTCLTFSSSSFLLSFSRGHLSRELHTATGPHSCKFFSFLVLSFDDFLFLSFCSDAELGFPSLPQSCSCFNKQCCCVSNLAQIAHDLPLSLANLAIHPAVHHHCASEGEIPRNRPRSTVDPCPGGRLVSATTATTADPPFLGVTLTWPQG